MTVVDGPESQQKRKAAFSLAAISELFTKYFCEGQANASTLKANASGFGQVNPSNEDNVPKSFIGRHRKLIGIFVPIVIVHAIWWTYMGTTDSFHLFVGKGGANDIPRWYMSITMVFGSMVAGATSEGGAAVAFPVMTLVFGISPVIARDFSYIIQSCGMVCAAGTIIWMKVLVEWKAVIYTSLGGIAGIIIGLEYIALDPPYAKMYFVVIWGAFAASLYYLNRIHGRKVYLVLDPPHLPAIWKSCTLWELSSTGLGSYVAFNWKAAVLFATGFLGGIFSSISGSGIDICSFACLTLLFRLTEKTATPTSVILMAINTVVGFLWREYAQEGIGDDSWNFFLVCAPIVCFGAPFGSVIGSFVHRIVLAWAIYLTDAVQLVGAIVIVQPWVYQDKPGFTTPAHLTGSSIGIFVSGLIFFYILQFLGEKLVERNSRIEATARALGNSNLKAVGVDIKRQQLREEENGTKMPPELIGSTTSIE
eukprot:CAMPEP_0172610916 /NCGR_PEP_ID=MMETSP1068-20121228/30662_1 /TAXON_ID=35684 /ORGANISM="Pseudopedinella elastica, Strain CCMP716" /LENGTH=478 /DNA_ID=CAMNT_0013414741 /DNA_START=188 /DNA_END=1624 /DNA_ORIENTATION=-